MAKLVGIARDPAKPDFFKKRQLPISVEDEMRVMIAEFEDPTAGISESAPESGSGYSLSMRSFCQKISSLSPHDLLIALSVDYDQFCAFLAQFVPCVGCRRCVEKLFLDLCANGYPAIEPLTITNSYTVTVSRPYLGDYKSLYQLIFGEYPKARAVVDSLSKCKRNKRCALHSLDIHSCRLKASWDWEDVFKLMSDDCKDECCVIDVDNLQEMLDSYLQRHRFCPECKNKLQRAMGCLTGEVDASKEKGFNTRLFQGLRYCGAEHHIHVKTCTKFLNSLMERAEAELTGSSRERHAKTLEVGQVEVLTCIGLFMHSRLHKINMALKTLHVSFQLLYCVSLMALHANFQAVMESREGLNESFEQLCRDLQDSTANPQQRSMKAKKKKRTGKGTAEKGKAGRITPDMTSDLAENSSSETSETADSFPVDPPSSTRNSVKEADCGDSGYSSSREGSPPASLSFIPKDCHDSKGYTKNCSLCASHVKRLHSSGDSPLQQEQIASHFQCCSVAAKDRRQVESLSVMLENSNISDEYELGSSPRISQKEIDWFQQNESILAEQRQMLRRRIWDRFHAFQARLQTHCDDSQ